MFCSFAAQSGPYGFAACTCVLCGPACRVNQVPVLVYLYAMMKASRIHRLDITMLMIKNEQ